MSTRQKIIEVSYEEFITKGYKSTSLQVIASKLNMTKPALYYHFTSKKDLYLKVVEYYNSQLLEKSLQIDLSTGSSKEQLKDLLSNYFELTFPEDIDNRKNQYYFTVDAIHHFPDLKESILGSANPVVEMIKRILNLGIQRGEINADLDIQAIMFHIGIMIEGLSATSLLVNHIDRDIFNRYYDLFWKHMIE